MSPASSPSAFLVRGLSSKDDDLVLPYIARMRMEEEEMVDRLSYYQYADNHPALLQAQQPCAHILSGASSDAAMGAWHYNSTVELSPLQLAVAAGPCYSDDIDALAATVRTSSTQGNNVDSTLSFSFLMNGTATDAVEAPSSFLPAERSCMGDLATMAFFKGMEVGSKFLPTYSERADGTGRRKRLESDDEVEVQAAMGRRSKQMAVPPQPESEEESAAREMMDKLMLSGYDACLADANTEDPRGVMDMAKTPLPPGRSGASTARHAVDLHTMLIRCAEAVSCNDRRGAADLLQQIRCHSSPTGDGMQRLAHCFADGLEARMAGTGSQLYQSLVAKGTSTACVLKAYQLFMVACFFVPVEYLFSNTTICNAVAGRKKLHIVHYGLGHGLQWPDLLRRFACQEGGPPEVRLTGIDSPQPGFHSARRIEETGRRLSVCARQVGVPFEFRGIAAKSDAVHAEDLNIDADEVLVVNCLYHFRTLMDESVVVDRPNPRDMVLQTIRKMRPKVFIHGVFNGSHCAAYFMSRFREALHQYTALFDMMDTIVPQDSERRLQVEQGIFARCAVNIIACEGADRVERSQSYKQWEARSQRAGLRLLPPDPEIVRMLRDKVKESHKYFVINEDDGWLLHGWKGRMLYALSTWTSDDDT